MHIKFLLLTNVIITIAHEIPWVSDHRFYQEDQKLPSNHRRDVKSVTKNNEQLRIQKTKKDKSIIHKDIKITEEKMDSIDPWNLPENADRIQFQIEGHKGPQTYIFGFDTGYGKNRQYRLEEKHPDGTIKGQYGYYDAKGKLRKVRYIARPFQGYTEVHHESNLQKEDE